MMELSSLGPLSCGFDAGKHKYPSISLYDRKCLSVSTIDLEYMKTVSAWIKKSKCSQSTIVVHLLLGNP